MYYESNKRDKNDKCNICGKQADLTWDHIPPKFNRNNGRTSYSIPFSLTGVGNKTRDYYISQNGIKFRSICSFCNNTLLGSIYDITYKEYIDAIESIIFSGNILPRYLTIKVEINRLCRAIVGHLLAAKNFYDDCEIDKELRKYFLDQTMLPPQNYRLQQLFYPFADIFLIRDAALVCDEGKRNLFPDGAVSCLSSPPLSLILSQGEAITGLLDLFSLCTINIGDICMINFDVLSCFYNNTFIPRSPNWPCVIDMEYGVYGIIGGTSMMDSIHAHI